MKILKLRENKDMAYKAAEWFHNKWDISLNAYIESIHECLKGDKSIPQWYIVIEDNRIIGGIGVIDNDFHNRKDLSPNVCALYVEEEYRCQGIAGQLLDYVYQDMKSFKIDVLYLISNHILFYERYGYKFHCMVQEVGSSHLTRMYVYK